MAALLWRRDDEGRNAAMRRHNGFTVPYGVLWARGYGVVRYVGILCVCVCVCVCVCPPVRPYLFITCNYMIIPTRQIADMMAQQDSREKFQQSP